MLASTSETAQESVRTGWGRVQSLLRVASMGEPRLARAVAGPTGGQSEWTTRLVVLRRQCSQAALPGSFSGPSVACLCTQQALDGLL